ncbi:MAG: InlB B-repeat-containing protein, partial [Oscillospiraceae bacterium]|nr:InlB B-repeat-containing protein [Oscillospiraceae bacterium]
IPAIHAYAQDGIEVAIRQTTAIPGTASITASRGGVSVSYTIHFNRPPTSDNFMSGVIGSQWSIVRPNSSNYRVNQNGLQITTVTNQDIQASTGTNSNMFLQSGFGDWTVTTDIVVENVPNTNWQQMGIVVYEDTPVVAGVANAFIKFVIEHSSNLHILMVGRRTGQNTGNLSSGNVQINTGDVVTMRLNREGNVYTAYYSVNGGEFNRLGTSITYPMENVKVGFTAFSSGSSPPFNTTFKNFNVELPSETVMDEAELSDITLDGQGLQGFDPIIREYTVLLEDGAQPPIVRAVTSGITSEFIEIEQTEQAPGRAVVSYGVGSAWRDYVINFAYGSQHGITYMPNGAAGEPITDQSLAYNDTYYTNLNTFVNTGRTFIGWNTEPDGSGMPYAENEEIAVKESMTLYAIWKADNDTTNVDVTFDTQAAGVGTPSAKIVTFGSRYGELPIVNRAGYSFNGWFTHQNSGKEITGEKIVTNPANHTLYARWGRNVTVSFDTQAAGVGVPTPNSIQVIEGRQYGKLPVPVRRGYAFDGWFTQRSGGTKINAISTVTNNANHTLYAGWTAVTMRISFNTQTADVANPPSVIASFGDNYGTLPVPNRDEYIWGGWYTQPTGGTAVTEMTVIADASNHTLFARWTMEGEHAKGDVNGDGIVNIFDMILIRDHIVGRTILPARSLRAADAVADDIIDVKDIIAIRDSILGVVRL